MKRLANYVMRGPKQAIILAVLCTCLPFFAWLGSVIMALVCLRKGPKEGFIILLWISLPSVVLAIIGYPDVLLGNIVFGYLLTWLLAYILRSAKSWTLVMELAVLLGIVAVLITHLVIGDVQQYWLAKFASFYTKFKEAGHLQLPLAEVKLLVQPMLPIATGGYAVLVIVSGLVNLGVARWLDLKITGVGGLRNELSSLKIGWTTMGVMVVIMATAFLGSLVATDVSIIVFFPFILTGMILVHRLIARVTFEKLWLAIFYFMLVTLLPYMLVFLVITAFLDAVYQFRRRYVDSKQAF